MIANRKPLRENAFYPLPLGRITPKGWLRDQLKIQAEGFTGLLPDHWEPLGKNSGWLGGGGESWERGPYYLDGLLPLAFLLGDEALQKRALAWITWTLQSQREDGMFGPPSNDDWWPRMVMLKVLAQWEEATGDERVAPFMLRYLRYMARHLGDKPLRDWGQARGGEAVWSALWLYNRTGEGFLLDLIHTLHHQTLDWTGIFSDFPYWRYQTRFDHRVHVVNVAMGLKEPALYGLLSGEARHLDAPRKGIAALTRYHGQLNGAFSGDEWLAGTSPTQGTELCGVVEYMFTLEALYAALGDSALYDILERLAFNALPATISEDWMTHQYVQQVNQIACNAARRNWTENRDDANMFGLEPNFGCCTANMHQGWPKFAANLWQQTPGGEYVASSYAPCLVRLEHGGVLEVEGNYPFEDRVRIRYTGPSQTLRLRLRRPGWCQALGVMVGTEKRQSDEAYVPVERTFHDGDVLEISLPMTPRVEKRANGAIGLLHGPLLFSLPLKARWWRRGGSLPFADYELFPADGEVWNYALALDPNAPERNVEVSPGVIQRQAFQAEHPALKLRVKARRCEAWQVEQHSAGELPLSPVQGTGAEETLELLPYGGCKLRVTEMPVLEREDADGDV